MIKPKLELNLQNDADLLASSVSIKNGMTTHATEFPDSTATVTAIGAAATAFGTALQAATDGKIAQQALIDTKDAKRVDLESLLRTAGHQVDDVAKGDINVIHDAGMHGSNEPLPVIMPQVQNLTLTPSERTGEVMAYWDTIDGSRVYRVQTSTDAAAPTTWIEKLRSTKASCSLNHDLVSGSKVWVRVCAVGARDEGAWSEVASKIVP